MKTPREKAAMEEAKIQRQIKAREHTPRGTRTEKTARLREEADSLHAAVERLRKIPGQGMKAWALQNHWARLEDQLRTRE